MGHPHDYVADGGRMDKGTGKGKNVAGAKPKVYGNSNYKPKEEGQAGGPVSHEWRRRQMLFDYGVDIGDEFKKKGGGR